MEMDVIKWGRCCLTILLLLAANSLDAQVSNPGLKKYIAITGAGMRVDSFLNLVSRQTGLGFSFNSKKISPAKYISLPKGSYSIAQCLAEIQRVTGIHYAVMNDHIILVDNPPQEKYRLNLGVVAKKPVAKKKPVARKPIVKVVPRRDTLIVRKEVVKDMVVVKDTIVTPVIKDTVVRDSLPGSLPRKNGLQLPGIFPVEPDTTVLKIDSTSKKKVLASTKAIAQTPSSKRDRSTYSPGRPASSFNEYDQSAASFHVGIVGLRPDVYKMIGIGINLLYEKPFANDNWSLTGSAGYHLVLGDYTATKFKYDTFVSPDTMSIDTTLKNFSQLPLLIGVRCYVVRPFYAALEAGYTIRASDDVSSFLSVSPSLGLKFPAGRKAIDINFKYLYMVGSPTIPEKTRLQKGDYGFWCLRVAYAF